VFLQAVQVIYGGIVFVEIGGHISIQYYFSGPDNPCNISAEAGVIQLRLELFEPLERFEPFFLITA